MGISVKNGTSYWDPLLQGTGWFNYGGNAGGNGVGKGMGATSGNGTSTGAGSIGAALGSAAVIGGAALKTQMDYDKFKDLPTNPPVKPPLEQPKVEGNAPIIEDKTDENLGTTTVSPIDTSFDPYAWAKAMRDEEWAREDKIRAETQAREDTAIQRATEDALRAGINPNLVGITPAQSGGGITNQTGSMDYTMSAAEYNKKMELLMQEIEQNFKGDENEKDRFTNLIRTLIMGSIMLSK